MSVKIKGQTLVRNCGEICPRSWLNRAKTGVIFKETVSSVTSGLVFMTRFVLVQ